MNPIFAQIAATPNMDIGIKDPKTPVDNAKTVMTTKPTPIAEKIMDRLAFFSNLAMTSCGISAVSILSVLASVGGGLTAYKGELILYKNRIHSKLYLLLVATCSKIGNVFSIVSQDSKRNLVFNHNRKRG